MLKLSKRVSAFAGAIALSLGGMFTFATPAVAAATPSDAGVVHQHAEPLADTDDTTLETADATATEANGEMTAPDATADATAGSTTDATDGAEPTEGPGATDDTEATDDTGETQEVSPFASDGPMEDVTPVTLTLGQAAYTQAETTAGVTWSALDMTPNDRVIVSVGGVRLESDIVASAEGTASGLIIYTAGTGFSLAAAGSTSDPFPIGTYEVKTEQDLGLGTYATVALTVTGDAEGGLNLALGQTDYTAEESAVGIAWSMGGMEQGQSYYLYVNGYSVGGNDLMENVPDANGNANGVVGFQEMSETWQAFFVDGSTGIPVPAGTYTLEVRVTDADFNELGSTMVTFVVHEPEPQAPVVDEQRVWFHEESVPQSETVDGVMYQGDGWSVGTLNVSVTDPSGVTSVLEPIEIDETGMFIDTLVYNRTDAVTGVVLEQLAFPVGNYTITVEQGGVERTASFTVTADATTGGNAPAANTSSSNNSAGDSLAVTGANQAALFGMLAGAGALLLLGGALILVRKFRANDS